MKTTTIEYQTGFKPKADLSPLDLSMLPDKRDWRRAAAFMEHFLTIPKGFNVGLPFILHKFQKDIIRPLLPANLKRPRAGLTSISRGNGKSTLAAALCLYFLFADSTESAQVLNIASDMRQAHIVFDTAVRMIQLSPELASRAKIYSDKILVPGTNSAMFPLPADENALQGWDPSFACVDEIAYCTEVVWESIIGAAGKRIESLVWAISTPPQDDTGVMHQLVSMAKSDPQPDLAYSEYTSDSSHELSCLHCAKAANPALGKFLDLKGLRSVQRTMRESSFRRLRLGQFGVATDSAYIPPDVYRRTTDAERPLLAGERVVLALDGSYSGDTTALVLCTIDNGHHLAVQGLWEPQQEHSEYRVPIEQVEERIREVSRTFSVQEIVCDPYRYQHTIQQLEKEGLPVSEFPQSPQRMSPATMNLQEAFFEGLVTHGADDKMRAHFMNAKLRDDHRGQKIQKESKMSEKKIDIAVAAIMAHSRASFYATRPQKKGRAIAW